MDPKLVNYSKLQIPILNGAAHSYVIMPALLSQIDVTNYATCESTEIETTTSFPNIYFTNDNTTANAYDTDQQQNHLSNKIQITSGSHGYSTYNNDDANTDDSTSKSQSTVDKNKNNKSSKRLNTKRANKLSLQLHHEPNQSPDLDDSSELLELNSPISISKFIFKETDCMQHQHQQQQQQTLMHNINPDNLLNDNHIDNGGRHVHSLESYNDLNNQHADFINGKPLSDVSPNSSDEANNCDSVTYIVNCPTLSDVDLNHMMNCFIALNKLNDADNIGWLHHTHPGLLVSDTPDFVLLVLIVICLFLKNERSLFGAHI
jgi:hypothetical protein